MPRPTLGSTVGGKYKLLRALGEGGMGTVYEVEHVLTHKRAAIKWVHPQTGSSDSAHDRLLHEARATSRIHHHNVVDVYDVLREDDAVCLVMQLLVGEPLSERIARGPFPFTEFVALLLPAMRGVAAAHAAGVIHRDIKPDNIFLSRDTGQPEIVPKVIDFGISKVFDPMSPNSVTRSGITMGTPKYVSYEQLLGARDVDGRADVYAFGVMLYEALTGQLPYRAGTFGEQAVAFAMSVPPRPSVLRAEIPIALDVIVYRAIAKDREQRIGSIEALITELEPFLQARAYPQPLLAFAQNSVRRVSGAPEPHDATSPAEATPASQRREDVPEVGRLSPPPSAPVAVAASVFMQRPRFVREPEGVLGRRKLASAAVLACAASLIALLVWWFQVPARNAAALPSAHAAADARGTPVLVEAGGSAREQNNEGSVLTPVAPASAPISPTPQADPSSAPRLAIDTPPASMLRSSAQPPARAAAELPSPRSRAEERATTRVNSSALPASEFVTVNDVPEQNKPVKGESTSPETHRAGRLTRDEF